MLSLIVRLTRPTQGTHTSPCGYLWELGAEARRNRSRRVRRYALPGRPAEPALTQPEPVEPTPPAPVPSVPAPRRPVEDSCATAHPQAEIVRGPYRAWERHRSTLRGLVA
ncbi:hypothetical protein ACWFMI_15225 [Nocardiopsis terrae]